MTLESVLLTEMSPSLLTPLVALLGSLGSFKSCQEGGRVEEKTEVHTAGVRTTVTTLATGVRTTAVGWSVFSFNDLASTTR